MSAGLLGATDFRTTGLRLAIAAGIPLLLFLLAVVPAWNRAEDAGIGLSEAYSDLAWLRAKVASVPGPVSPRNLPPPTSVDLERLLQEHGLRPALSQLTDQTGGRMLLALDSAEFQSVVRFLHDLETRHRGALREVSVARDVPGFGKATVVIQGPQP